MRNNKRVYEINNSSSSIHNNDFHLFQTESEERLLSCSTFEDILCSAACVADDLDDDSEDDYESIEQFREKKSAARSLPPSSWRPSRFEGSIYDYRRCLAKTSPTLPPCPATRLDALEAAPIHQASRRREIPVEVLHELSSSSSFPHVGASMSDRLRPPAASQVPYDMSLPHSVDSLSSIRWSLPPSADAMMSRTRPAPPPPPLSSYEPPSSDLLSFESLDCIEDRFSCFTQMSSQIFSPMSPIVSSEEFASEIYASNLPVCADLPHSSCLISISCQQPSPTASGDFAFSEPAVFTQRSFPMSGDFDFAEHAVFTQRSFPMSGDFDFAEPAVFTQRSFPMSGDFDFAEHAVSPQPSPAASGGFGGSLRSRNERLASSFSALVARRVKGKERLLRGVEKPDTVAWNELFELQHEVSTHDLIQ